MNAVGSANSIFNAIIGTTLTDIYQRVQILAKIRKAKYDTSICVSKVQMEYCNPLIKIIKECKTVSKQTEREYMDKIANTIKEELIDYITSEDSKSEESDNSDDMEFSSVRRSPSYTSSTDSAWCPSPFGGFYLEDLDDEENDPSNRDYPDDPDFGYSSLEYEFRKKGKTSMVDYMNN